MASRSLGHRAPLLWLVLPLIAGLAAGDSVVAVPPRWLLAAAAPCSALAVVAAWRDWRRTWAAAVVAALLLAGAAGYTLHRRRLAEWDTLPAREARLAFRVDRVFPKADPRRIAGLATLVRADAPLRGLAGQRLYFSLTRPAGQPAPVCGAVLAATGVLAPLPRNPPAATFDGFLANAGVNFRLGRGRVLAEEHAAPAYDRFCSRTLENLSAILGLGVEAKRPELVGIFRAMLLGQQHELTAGQVALFRQTGTMHVFSISGLHIAVIAGGLVAVLTLLRFPTWLALGPWLAALWLYVDVTGGAPSAIRAFGMAVFVRLAFVLRVARSPLSALAASALLVLLATPLDVFSASFQMSYGIVLALLVMGLPLADAWQEKLALFRDLPPAAWSWLQRQLDLAWRSTLSAVAIGLASSLVGTLTGAQFFGMLTPGALLANLWVIPVSSVVILLGLVSLLGGLAGLASVNLLANHAAVLVLWVMDHGLRLNVRLPGMWCNATFRAPWLGPTSLAVLAAALLAGYATGWRRWARGYWPPFAVLATTLLFGLSYG